MEKFEKVNMTEAENKRDDSIAKLRTEIAEHDPEEVQFDLHILIKPNGYENAIEIMVSGTHDSLKKLEEYEKATNESFEFVNSGDQIAAIGLMGKKRCNLITELDNLLDETKELLEKYKANKK